MPKRSPISLLKRPAPVEAFLVFPSELGWMALRTAGKIVRQLAFGHVTAEAARRAIGGPLRGPAPWDWWHESLVHRLQAYAHGLPMDFRDVAVDPGERTLFQKKIMLLCREILYGKRATYGRLACLAGSPGAARAVGNCMAANPVPLVIPCHRVVPANGAPGPFSAPGGTRMKRRLLDMEARSSLVSPAELG